MNRLNLLAAIGGVLAISLITESGSATARQFGCYREGSPRDEPD
jgi:hypothetical protein